MMSQQQGIHYMPVGNIDGKTVIITSHDLSEIEKCADDVSMIKNGRLLFVS